MPSLARAAHNNLVMLNDKEATRSNSLHEPSLTVVPLTVKQRKGRRKSVDNFHHVEQALVSMFHDGDVEMKQQSLGADRYNLRNNPANPAPQQAWPEAQARANIQAQHPAADVPFLNDMGVKVVKAPKEPRLAGLSRLARAPRPSARPKPVRFAQMSLSALSTACKADVL